VLALYSSPAAAAAAARAVHDAGVRREQISVVARNHAEEGALARQMDATPGADIEDSRRVAVFGELGGQVLAAMALVLPGIGPIVAAGPLSAELGEAAGHAAGSVASVLSSAGVPRERAEALEHEVDVGSILLAVHVTSGEVEPVHRALQASEPLDLVVANWRA
jgi:hypothetical protein